MGLLFEVGNQLVFLGDSIEFFVGEMFDVDHLILRGGDGVDELVQLEIDGAGVPVLGVLNEEHHEKGDDGGAGVDDELPGVGVVIDGAGDRPGKDDSDGGGEGPARAEIIGCKGGKLPKPVFG